MRNALDAPADNLRNIGPFVHPKRQHRRNHAVKLAFWGESPCHRIPDERRHGAQGLFHVGNGKQVAREKVQEKQQHQRRGIADGIDEKLNGQRRNAAFPGGKVPNTPPMSRASAIDQIPSRRVTMSPRIRRPGS